MILYRLFEYWHSYCYCLIPVRLKKLQTNSILATDATLFDEKRGP